MALITYASELQIASGWNNTAGYSLVTALTDSDSIPFVLPHPFTNRSRGIAKPRLSRRVDYISNLIATWVFPHMTLKQLDYLRTTYYDANDSKVTIRTITNNVNSTSFDDYNAYISLPQGLPEVLSNDTLTGVGVVHPGNYLANWVPNIVIGFAIDGTSS